MDKTLEKIKNDEIKLDIEDELKYFLLECRELWFIFEYFRLRHDSKLEKMS